MAAAAEPEELPRTLPGSPEQEGLVDLKGGSLRKGRLSEVPSSTRARAAREMAKKEASQLQLVKRGGVYLAPRTRANTVFDRERLRGRRAARSSGPSRQYDYQHQQRRRSGPSGSHRSIAPHEWFAWQAGQSGASIQMLGAAVASTQPPPPAAAAEPAQDAARRASRRGHGADARRSRQAAGSPWASRRPSSGHRATTAERRVESEALQQRSASELSLSGGQVEGPAAGAEPGASAPPAAADGDPDAADGNPAAQAEPAPRLAHTPSKYVSRNHEESSGHVDLDVARGSATSMSPMGVDLSQHSGALSRKLQMHGHHAGSFTLPPKPHSPGRAGSPSGSVALSASVEAESWSATLDDDTIQVIRLIGAEGLSRRPPVGACRLFLGPGFRLAACWNRLVETVKTRKKRGKMGGKWARYGLKRVKEGS